MQNSIANTSMLFCYFYALIQVCYFAFLLDHHTSMCLAIIMINYAELRYTVYLASLLHLKGGARMVHVPWLGDETLQYSYKHVASNASRYSLL